MLFRIRILTLFALSLGVILLPRGANAFTCVDSASWDGLSSAGGSSVACGLMNYSDQNDFSTALGYVNHAEGEYSTTVGALNVATGINSSAIGYNNNADGKNATAIGTDSNAIAENAFAAGNGSTAHGVDSVVIGSGSAAMQDHSIALGSHSVTAPQHAGVFNIISGGIDGIAGTGSPGGTMSVGMANKERQIQNVASGVISSTSTDAVNGSQLYVVGAQVNANTANIATNTADIATNTAGINTLNTTVAAQSAQIATNTADIATNTTNIAANTAGINTLNTTVTAQSAQIATNTADIPINTTNINMLGATTAAALGGGSTYTASTGVSAPAYAVKGMTYNNVGSAISALDSSINSQRSQINGLQSQSNLLATGYLGHGQDIAALRNSVQRGYEGSAVAAATAAGNYLPENKNFALVGKMSQFRGQYGVGMQGQMRLGANIVGIASIGGGVRYGGVLTTGGLAIAW